MRKTLVLFITIFLLAFTLASPVLADGDFLVKVNDSALTTEEAEIIMQDKIVDLRRGTIRTERRVVERFIEEQAKKSFIEEKDSLEVSDDALHREIKRIESKTLSDVRGFFPLHIHQDEEPTTKDIVERLADLTDLTPDLIIYLAHTRVAYDLFYDYHLDKAEEKMEAGHYDDKLREAHEIGIKQAKEVKERIVEEHPNVDTSQFEYIINRSFEDFLESEWINFRRRVIRWLMEDTIEEFRENANIEIPHQ